MHSDTLYELEQIMKKLVGITEAPDSSEEHAGALEWIRYQLWKTKDEAVQKVTEGTWMLRALEIIRSGNEVVLEEARLSKLLFIILQGLH